MIFFFSSSLLINKITLAFFIFGSAVEYLLLVLFQTKLDPINGGVLASRCLSNRRWHSLSFCKCPHFEDSNNFRLRCKIGCYFPWNFGRCLTWELTNIEHCFLGIFFTLSQKNEKILAYLFSQNFSELFAVFPEIFSWKIRVSSQKVTKVTSKKAQNNGLITSFYTKITEFLTLPSCFIAFLLINIFQN